MVLSSPTVHVIILSEFLQFGFFMAYFVIQNLWRVIAHSDILEEFRKEFRKLSYLTTSKFVVQTKSQTE